MNPASYCSTVLPVGLLYFKAMAEQNKTWLQWSIATPELIKNFVIERSDPFNGWETISFLAANDHTGEYHFIDNNPMPGINQYRLKLIEKNNKLSYSPVQKIFIDINNKFDIYPNPATYQINVTGNFTSLTTFSISDPSGKLIWQKKLFSNNKIIKIDLPALSPGIYIIRINDSVKKLVTR